MNRKTSMYVENNSVFRNELSKGKDPKEFKRYCFRSVLVKEISQDLITKKVELVLSYMFNGEENLLRISRSVLTRSEILKHLPVMGIDVSDDNVMLFIEWVTYQEQFADITYTHENIGWYMINSKKVYLLDKAISIDDSIESTYVGKLSIAEVGSLEGHVQLLNEEVKGRPALELAYAIGLSSILVSFIREYLNFPVLFFHFFGASSIGKTVSALVSLSAVSKPVKTKNSLMITWYSTLNAIGAFLKNKIGLTFVIDESSSRANEMTTSLIYFLTDGLEKGRSTIEGEMRNQSEWSGTIVSTGEGSLLQNASHFEGIRVRLLELNLKQYTDSAENSKNIQRKILQNYSNSGRIFAKNLLVMGEDEIIRRFQECHTIVMDRFTLKDAFSDRTADRLSIVYLSGLLANEFFDLKFDMEKVLEILIEAETESISDRDLARQAYQYLIDFMNTHPGVFFRWQLDEAYKRNQDHPFKENVIVFQKIHGRIDYQGEIAKTVYFQSDIFNEILTDNGFDSPKVVLNAMKEKGILFTDKSQKLQVNRKLTTQSPARSRVYAIKIDPADSEIQKSITDASQQKTVVPMKKQRKKIDYSKPFADEEMNE